MKTSYHGGAPIFPRFAPSFITPEGGIGTYLINSTGGASVKGYVVRVSRAVDFGCELITVDIPDPIGVFYESGVSNGSRALVIISGAADVYFIGSTTRGNLARGFITGDPGYISGQAMAEALPSAPFATDKHFYELGHVNQSRTGAGLARTILHFN